MRNFLIPAVIVSSLLGSSAAYSTNLITGEDPAGVTGSGFTGTFSGGTVTINNGFVSLPFNIDVNKNYRLTYSTNSSSSGSIYLIGGSYPNTPALHLLLTSNTYSSQTSYTVGPSDLSNGSFVNGSA